MEIANYERKGTTLRIWGSLMWPLDMQFDIESNAMLEEAKKRGVKDVVIEVTDVDAMGSQYLGALAAVAAEMKRREGGLTVKAKGRVAELVRQVGLERLVTLDTG